MAYSGLDTLFQNLGPATAGMAAGYREREASDTQQLANLLEQERIREAQQKYQQSADKHPFTLEQLRLGNVTAEAGIPGIQADSSLKGTVATRAAAALQDNIDTDKYAAKTARLENIAKQHQQYEKVLSELGAHTAGIPAAAQPAAILSYLQSSGYDMEAPQIKNMLSRVATMKPEDLQKAFSAEKEWAAKHTPAFIQALQTEKQRGANSLEVAKVQGQNQANIEQIGINAGKYAHRGGGGGGSSYITTLSKTAPDRRLGAVQAILTSGISPETQSELTEVERAYYQSMYEQDMATVNANLQARSPAGVVPQVSGSKINVENRQPPTANVKKQDISVQDMRNALKGK